jgi:hypothetical protein
MEDLTKVYATLPAWLQMVVLVVGMAKLITFWTPTKVDDKWLGKATPILNGFLKGLNIAGLNMFKDKNRDDKR